MSTIMLVDDSATILLSISNILGKAGYTVEKAEQAGKLLEVSSADIEPAPAFGAKIRADFIDRMAKISGKIVIILDIQRVLSVDEMATRAMVGGRAAEPAAETH